MWPSYFLLLHKVVFHRAIIYNLKRREHGRNFGRHLGARKDSKRAVGGRVIMWLKVFLFYFLGNFYLSFWVFSLPGCLRNAMCVRLQQQRKSDYCWVNVDSDTNDVCLFVYLGGCILCIPSASCHNKVICLFFSRFYSGGNMHSKTRQGYVLIRRPFIDIL